MADYHRSIPATATMAQAETAINQEESSGALFADSQIAYASGKVFNLIDFNVVQAAPNQFFLRNATDPAPSGTTRCWPSDPNVQNAAMVLGGVITLVLGYRKT